MTDFAIQTGNLYRNKLNDVVLISSAVDETHRMHKKGFRFVDHRGSYYTQEGSVKSKLFGQLDLVEVVEIDAADVNGYLSTILDQMGVRWTDRLKSMRSNAKLYRFCKKAMPVACGANIGIGTMALRLGSPTGWISIGIGVVGLISDSKTPDHLYNMEDLQFA